ncbi:UvrD-helicase domain-containing protein [Clostridium sp. DJ247]|uniref:UvrD-helicase domain-containing protein n=1 Tax=Clostridium sp. DJ247 TaxID=2726188 RepID=UPI001628F0B4|nr:UvrD-helicase domain-containing protein [Clostridium sp. DJ247]MBC2581055.1 AAA family ATPase [Clostridium sp. DJ247]
MKISYSIIREKLLNHELSKKCIIISGGSGSGKTTLAIDKYKNLINEKKVNSENIIVFVMNASQMLTWKKNLDFDAFGEVRIYTYQGFVKKELIKFWPIIEQKCSNIERNRIRPEFVSEDTCRFMMEILVSYYRNKKGYFSNITSTSKRVANDLITNINNAAMSMVSFSEIGTRIYNSMEIKDVLRKETYEEMDEIISHYIHSLLKQGVVDYAIAIYLYKNYLMEDENYLQHLKKIKYLIVDDFDEICPCQLALINKIVNIVSKAILFKNPEGGFCTYYGTDNKYLTDNIKFNYDELELQEHYLCNNKLQDLIKGINNNTLENNFIIESELPINIDLSAQLHSEMINKVIVKIEEIMKNRGKIEDLVIISPADNFILNYELESRLKNLEIDLVNTWKNSRLIDNLYVQCLVVIACLCNNYKQAYLNIDNYRKFFIKVLNVNPVKASILAKTTIQQGSMPAYIEELITDLDINQKERYNYLKKCIDNFIQESKTNKIPLGELFRRAFLDLLITLPDSKDNIAICKNLSEAAERFIGILSQFNTIDNPEEKFISFVISEASDFYSLNELEQMYLNDKKLIITNPYNFLTCNLKSKIQIWVDINSNMWCPRNVKELTNINVIKNTWNINEVYTDKIEQYNKKYNLMALLKCLIKKCSEELYLYGSEYSVSGYEQSSLIVEIIEDITNKIRRE